MINSLLSDCSSFVTQADHRVVVDDIFRRYYCEVTSVDELFVSAPLRGRLMGATEFGRAEGKVALEKGYHALHLLYFENYMGQELEVGFLGRDIPETPIPAEMLFLPD